MVAWRRILSLGIGRGPKTHRGKRGGLDKFGDYPNRLKLCTINARSLRNKSTIFQDFVTDNKFDIVAVTETWLTPSDDAVIADLTPPGFAFLHHPRVSRRGGGVGFLYKDNLSVLINPSDHFTSFESMSAVSSNGTTSLEILVIYRPPGYQSFSLFINEFSDLLDEKLYKLYISPCYHWRS